MSHKHRHGKRHRHEGHQPPHEGPEPERTGFPDAHPATDVSRLEVVVVSDTVGTLDAVRTLVAGVSVPGVEIEVLHTGVGAVSKSDLQMAATGSRLVLGFNVGLNPLVEEEARGSGVEVRLYRVIYRLGRDLEEIALSLLPPETSEEVLGRAKVIALFKSSRKDIILGCEVDHGRIALGDRYRVVDVAGSVHVGRVDSLHVGPEVVREAHVGQQVGLKVHGFQKVQVGDLVETFRLSHGRNGSPWQPRGGVLRVE